MNQVEQFLRNCLGISDETIISQIENAATIRTVPKGAHWAHQGNKFTGVTFLISGLFRFYFLDCEGREHTDCFSSEAGDPVIATLGQNESSLMNIQALEDSRVLILPNELVQALMEDNIYVVRLYNQMLMRSLAQHWEDKLALHQYDAARRYEWFLTRYDGSIHRVQHMYIASFLNISPVTLSRLRSKKV